jgi:hypothetical protein
MEIWRNTISTHGMGLVSRARNEDSLQICTARVLITVKAYSTATKYHDQHSSKKDLPAGELSGAPALVVQASAYCFQAVAHMTSNKQKRHHYWLRPNEQSSNDY